MWRVMLCSPQKPMHPLHEIRYFLLNLIKLRDYLGIHWAGYKAGHKAVVSLLPRTEELSKFRDHFHVFKGTGHGRPPRWPAVGRHGIANMASVYLQFHAFVTAKITNEDASQARS
jgi:hypothetical protein